VGRDCGAEWVEKKRDGGLVEGLSCLKGAKLTIPTIAFFFQPADKMEQRAMQISLIEHLLILICIFWKIRASNNTSCLSHEWFLLQKRPADDWLDLAACPK